MNSWEIVSLVLAQMKESAREGMNCLVLADVAEGMIRDRGAVAFNKNYHPTWAKIPFPASICIGVNDEVVHAIPKDYRLKDGDLVSFDVSVKKDGVCADAGFTMAIGTLSFKDQRLLEVARMTLDAGLDKIKNGVSVIDIATAMWATTRARGYVIFKSLTGHGIGSSMHMTPTIPMTVPDGLNGVRRPLRRTELPTYYQTLKTGQMVCIEPYVTLVKTDLILQEDGWTQKTKNGEKSAFFEAQVLVTPGGYNLLTTHLE